jgi:hypothetical protein
MLDKSTILKHYKREDIQNAIIDHARFKEIGMCFGKGYAKRPDILSYPREVIELAKSGVSSFHASEELWQNPLEIHSDMKKKELEEIRIGWDLVLDIDCLEFKYSRICANLIIKFLDFCEVKDYSCKFSGNKGFHIGVPFQAFPSKVGEIETRDMFPDIARKIAEYIKIHIDEQLTNQIIEFEQGDISKIAKNVKLTKDQILKYEEINGVKKPKLDVDKFLEIDTVLISSRHLYRMPYSLHEKSGLVSVPINPKNVLKFEKKDAIPANVKVEYQFLNREIIEPSAKRLLLQALDYKFKTKEEDKPKNFDEIQIKNPIKQELFPPCIHNIMNGVDDGKKRALFILQNFLGKIGYKNIEVEKFVHEWNKKNPDQLREAYIKGQFANFRAGTKLPPNCNNDAGPKGIVMCTPNSLCAKIKNPVNYTILRWRRHLRDEKEKQEKEDLKEKRKVERKKLKELEKDKLKEQEESKEPNNEENQESKETTNEEKIEVEK